VKRDIGLGRFFVVGASVALLLSSCAAPPPPAEVPLGQALLKETGYELGPDNPVHRIEGGACVAESRYQGESGPVLVMVCVVPLEKEGGRIRYRINYSPPAAGHRIWKIDASLPDQTLQNLGIIEELERKYGTASASDSAHQFAWKAGTANLEIEEDRYGVQISLWDRSVRQD
tara:strand:+ start:12469 stop:12987 length:519 start_codon:yes stop_codon:yes gene_type:complete